MDFVRRTCPGFMGLVLVVFAVPQAVSAEMPRTADTLVIVVTDIMGIAPK